MGRGGSGRVGGGLSDRKEARGIGDLEAGDEGSVKPLAGRPVNCAGHRDTEAVGSLHCPFVWSVAGCTR